MIARTATPERWSGVFFTALTIGQFLLAATCAAYVVPRFHANGGFALLAILCVLFAPVALFAPARYEPLPDDGRGGAPPLRGWVALLGCLLLGSAASGVAIYIVPLAEEAGLGAGVGGGANAVSLAAQVLAGITAVALAGRVRYIHVFIGGALAYAAAWTVFGFAAPAWLFLAASGVFGFVLLFVGPFFVPMTIDVDATRRTAVQSGTAQVFGGALGPLLASLTVSDHHARGVLILGAGLVVVALALIGYLHATHKEAAPA
jgi:hypothetical protein